MVFGKTEVKYFSEGLDSKSGPNGFGKIAVLAQRSFGLLSRATKRVQNN
jgi:hypothetical protein